MESESARQERVDLLASMRPQIIPDHQKGARDLPQELEEEMNDPTRLEILVRVKTEIQRDTIPPRRHHESTDGRHFLMESRALEKHGCFPLHRPGAAYQRRHQEARFINKDQRGVQPLGFFLIRGQSTASHRWRAFSSRSIARLWGFWGVKPSERNTRPI